MSERAKRPSLGRGLAALLGETPSPPSETAPGLRQVPIETIHPSPLQPRRHFAEAELEELAQSIREKGILQPLLVRAANGGEGEAGFELIAGERRWRAAQRAGVHQVPVVVRAFGDAEVLEIALIENLQRAELSALEEAEAYSRLMREFGRSQTSLAETLGKSRSHVANTMRLLLLPKSVRQLLETGALSAGHARALLALPDPVTAAQEVVSRGLNVRATEALVRRRISRPAASAPASQPRDPDTAALERELTDRLGLKVTIASRGTHGTLTLHYSDIDQLQGVLKLLQR